MPEITEVKVCELYLPNAPRGKRCGIEGGHCPFAIAPHTFDDCGEREYYEEGGD